MKQWRSSLSQLMQTSTAAAASQGPYQLSCVICATLSLPSTAWRSVGSGQGRKCGRHSQPRMRLQRVGRAAAAEGLPFWHQSAKPAGRVSRFLIRLPCAACMCFVHVLASQVYGPRKQMRFMAWPVRSGTLTLRQYFSVLLCPRTALSGAEWIDLTECNARGKDKSSALYHRDCNTALVGH